MEWLLALLFGAAPAAAVPDYTADVAAEAAYASLLPDTAPVKPKVKTEDCTTCNATGRVRTGDGQGWTKCPDCEPNPALPRAELTGRSGKFQTPHTLRDSSGNN